MRLEKLRFIVDELSVASDLAKNASTPEVARLLARHVAVRARDFIGHVRQVRQPLNLVAAGNAELKARVNEYSDTFDTYFGLVRDKVGAHLQDIDLFERAELWVSIDRSMVEYFADGSREIWDLLGTLGTPGHLPFVTPAALADLDVANRLSLFSQSSAAMPALAVDWFASTRPNALMGFNGTPVHARAGQLALLRRWMFLQIDMLRLFGLHPDIARLLRARLLTDIVNFHDCLITRPVSASAPQAMPGLDALLGARTAGAEAIAKFAATNRDDQTIEPLRAVRDRVGAHLDIDPTVDLATLTGELDGYDLDTALVHYARLEAVFLNVCKATVYLKMYLADGTPIHGVQLAAANPRAAYDPAQPDTLAAPPAAPSYSPVEMNAQLALWGDGSGPFADGALRYFREAFSNAPIVDTREYWDDFGVRKRRELVELREPHKFLHDHLVTIPNDVQRICAMLVRCSSGFPAALAETLFDAHRNGLPVSVPLLHGLGELMAWWQETVRDLLLATIASGERNLALAARSALLTMFLRDEGLSRTNGRSQRDWVTVRDTVLRGVPVADRMATSLALASCFVSGTAGYAIGKFSNEYTDMTDAIVGAARAVLAGTLDAHREAALRQWLDTRRLARATQLLFETGRKGHAASAKAALLTALRDGDIRVPRDADELSALAECMVNAGNPGSAIPILEEVCRQHPERVEPHLRIVEIIAEIPQFANVALEQAKVIRQHLQLDPHLEARLVAVERRFSSI